jgi:hypothetical protein
MPADATAIRVFIASNPAAKVSTHSKPLDQPPTPANKTNRPSWVGHGDDSRVSESIQYRKPDCLGRTLGRSRQIRGRGNVVVVYAVSKPEQRGGRDRGNCSIMKHPTAYDAWEPARTSCEARIRRAARASSVARLRQASVAIAPRIFITKNVSKAA